jgi:hypothetical protein
MQTKYEEPRALTRIITQGSCDPPPCSIEGQIQRAEGQKHNIPKLGSHFLKTNMFFNIYLIFEIVIRFC